MAEDDTVIVTVNLSLEEVDTVLNALEEKALNVKKLRQNIFNNVNQQVIAMQLKPEDDKKSKKKGKN